MVLKLDRSNDLSELQSENINPISTTFFVLKDESLIEVNLLQYLNMPFISVIDSVLNFSLKIIEVISLWANISFDVFICDISSKTITVWLPADLNLYVV